MAEANRLNLNVGIPGDSERKVPPLKRKVTLEEVIKWIKSLGHDEYVTTHLIKIVSSITPNGTYSGFKSNLNNYITQIGMQRVKEEE